MYKLYILALVKKSRISSTHIAFANVLLSQVCRELCLQDYSQRSARVETRNTGGVCGSVLLWFGLVWCVCGGREGEGDRRIARSVGRWAEALGGGLGDATQRRDHPSVARPSLSLGLATLRSHQASTM